MEEQIKNMLLEFHCSNFRSFGAESGFTTYATFDDVNENLLAQFQDKRVLRTMAFYGASGAGKSNLVEAMAYVKELIRLSVTLRQDSCLPVTPNRLIGPEVPSSFQLMFTKNGLRYSYTFSVLKGEVQTEHLYIYPNGRRTTIFDREGLKVTPGNRYRMSFHVGSTLLQKGLLFLPLDAAYSRVRECSGALKFLENDLVICRSRAERKKSQNWLTYSAQTLARDEETKKIFLGILDRLGTGVKDVRVEDTQWGNGYEPRVHVVYDRFETDLCEESAGIQTLFTVLCPMIDILENGKVLIVDEFDIGLHTGVERSLIRLFYNMCPWTNAQLIFTTRDISLLESGLFRRDQIWLVAQNEDRSSKVYCLFDRPNVRKKENLAHGYLQGRYGAVPKIADDWSEVAEQMAIAARKRKEEQKESDLQTEDEKEDA